MDITPDTTLFMIAGYAVIFTVLVIYIGSLVLRARNLRKDEEMLDEIEKK